MKYNDFPLKAYDKLRYCDTDKQGHVNNANFSTFFETGRTELLYLHEGKPIHDKDGGFVIARIELDYIAEIKWPGTVEIGTLVNKVGTSSIGLYQKIFQNGQLVAAASTVIVHIDNKTKKSKPLSSSTREILMYYYRDITE